MFVRLLAALVLAAAPAAARAADEENPYKDAKVGDYANYKMTTKVAGMNVAGKMVQTVTAKSEKEVTLTVTGSADLNGKEVSFPTQEVKIDLTKPFDPAAAGSIPGGADAKIEKLKEGKEKVKVGGKEYDASWTTYKAKMKQMGQELDADMKVWSAKGVPMLKTTMEAKIFGQTMEVTLELTETGNKK